MPSDEALRRAAKIPGEWVDEAGALTSPAIERTAARVPETYPLPDLKAVRRLSPDEQIALAQRYGMYPSAAEQAEAMHSIAEQIKEIPRGTEDWWGEVVRVTETETKTRATVLARTAQRTYQQQAAASVNPGGRYIRISEGDDNVCDGCAALEGAEGTEEELRAIGWPGEQDCGGNCRCTITPARHEGEWIRRGKQAAELVSAVLVAEWLL